MQYFSQLAGLSNRRQSSRKQHCMVNTPKRRWYRLSPDRFVAGLILVVGLLWLSERFGWFEFNHYKGWTVLIAMAAVGAAILLKLLWWTVGLVFRWRFQFGIRSLLALMVAGSIAFAWLAVEIEHARRAAEAVEWVNASGGSAYHDWQLSPPGDTDARQSYAEVPDWLVDLLGMDFFSAVYRVDISSTGATDDAVSQFFSAGPTRRPSPSPGGERVTDAGLAHLEALTQLQMLWINCGSQITDAGLQHLEGLTQLRVLMLAGNSRITDAGLTHLKGLVRLEQLNLGGTKVGGAGMENLENLKKLQFLGLACARVTDAGLEHIKGLAELQELNLTQNDITDAGLLSLASLSHLTELYLDCNTITDRGVEHLKGLTHLGLLGLAYTDVTDACVTSLTKLSRLTTLAVPRGRLTTSGLESLSEALPACRVLPTE